MARAHRRRSALGGPLVACFGAVGALRLSGAGIAVVGLLAVVPLTPHASRTRNEPTAGATQLAGAGARTEAETQPWAVHRV
ncbi:hypothetical protein ACN2WE_40645 [Streptomyces sp. cg28]|uniref:hypothetical protein n=1 Tax=Streptomyces sp. cg28 TaxID=3403457 RepID=UPI003B2102FA